MLDRLGVGTALAKGLTWAKPSGPIGRIEFHRIVVHEQIRLYCRGGPSSISHENFLWVYFSRKRTGLV